MNESPKRTRKGKLLVLAGFLIAGSWALHHHSQSLIPILEQEKANRDSIAKLNGQLESARRDLDAIKASERRATGARAELIQWSQERPMGPPIVWFPGKLKEHLHRLGITEAGIRLNTELPEPGVSEFTRTYWHVNLPPQEGLQSITALLSAVAEIERLEPWVKIMDCVFHSDADAKSSTAGGFNVEALIRK